MSNTFTDLIENIKDLYLSNEDIEEIVGEPRFYYYFEEALSSIPLKNHHETNPDWNQRQFAKHLFNYIKNYDKKLEKQPKEIAKIVFKVFYGEDIQSCNEPYAKRFSVIDGRKAINELKTI